MELLRPHQFCDTCNSYMELKTDRRFNDGYCWSCPQAEHFRSVRHGSILHKRKISLSNFLHLLWLFCTAGKATHTWIAMDISTSPWIIDVDSSTLQRACIQIPVKVCGTTLSVTREGGTDEPGLIQLQWTWHSVNLCGWRDLILHVLMFLFVRVLTLRFLSSWKEPLVE